MDQLPSQPLIIAVDTEYQGTATLTIQAACRINDDEISVKIYRCDDVPKLNLNAFRLTGGRAGEGYFRFCKRIIKRSVGAITRSLSPVRIMGDLFDIADLAAIPLRDAEQRLDSPDSSTPCSNAEWDDRGQRWKVPTIDVVLVMHFAEADFGRIFGREFLEEVLGVDESAQTSVAIDGGKSLSFVERRGSWDDRAPVVQYAEDSKGNVYRIRLDVRDTMLPFGHASLDELSRTFLGFGKLDNLEEDEKANMLAIFRERPVDAYRYAAADVLNTLLVHEQMVKQDRRIYQSFGFDDEEIPPMRRTLGSRVSESIRLWIGKWLAGSSQELGSDRKLRSLMREGGSKLFQFGHSASQFGQQTCGIHGGLNFSRSTTKFFHAAEEMLRDVDMQGCYNNAIVPLNVYWGRPVVLEPGSSRLSLSEAVALAKQHADDDGWFIRATGSIETIPNVLIPSTENAVTCENYRSRRRRRKTQLTSPVSRMHVDDEPGGARLYSKRIESGIVTHDTWLMIEALPPALRVEYEALIADNIVFYPRVLAASSGAEYDELVVRYASEHLPWTTMLDMQGLKLEQTISLDADYVTLKAPIGELAEEIGQARERARQKSGKGSGEERAWKLHANTMYGVLASEYFDTHNFVAANLITAKARTEAYAMMMALNGIQVITDGCTYRADQIPACTFEECLEIQPDYPVRRAESDIPFLDPASIPSDTSEFTEWYREHVKAFFGVSGASYDKLFATHDLEHKATGDTDSIAFDGLACDGSANYIKCTRAPDGVWEPQDFKARSYGHESKSKLQQWIVETYSTDTMHSLSPITTDRELLTWKQAVSKARQALEQGAEAVYLPLGMSFARTLNYRAIRPSAFVFQSPKQRAAILKQFQKFEEKTGCGLEVLTLRRSYGGRRQGALVDLAEQLYRLIQAGDRDVTKKFNLTRSFEALEQISGERLGEIQMLRDYAAAELFQQIADPNVPTGLVIGPNTLFWLE
jgi:hypothetical protein